MLGIPAVGVRDRIMARRIGISPDQGTMSCCFFKSTPITNIRRGCRARRQPTVKRAECAVQLPLEIDYPKWESVSLNIVFVPSAIRTTVVNGMATPMNHFRGQKNVKQLYLGRLIRYSYNSVDGSVDAIV